VYVIVFLFVLRQRVMVKSLSDLVHVIGKMPSRLISLTAHSYCSLQVAVQKKLNITKIHRDQTVFHSLRASCRYQSQSMLCLNIACALIKQIVQLITPIKVPYTYTPYQHQQYSLLLFFFPFFDCEKKKKVRDGEVLPFTLCFQVFVVCKSIMQSIN
jgi:hypothetical protein